MPHHSSHHNSTMLSPAPSNISINSDSHIIPIPILLKGKTPIRHEQHALVVPQKVVASSTNFSELRLSPRTACATLEGHSPSREELVFITRGLAGVACQNEINTQANRTQLATLKERGDTLAKHEENAACLEEMYKHWKTDCDQKLQQDADDQGEPEGYMSCWTLRTLVLTNLLTIYVLISHAPAGVAS